MNAQYKKWVELIATLLVVVGAINWGLVGLGWLTGGANYNVVHMIVGSLGVTVEAVVYVLVGASGVWLFYDWWTKMSKK